LIRYDDYRKPDGFIDWPALEAARKAAGESCRRCGHWLMFSKGTPTLCTDCAALDNDASSVRHATYLRCPACKHIHVVHEHCEGHQYEEGEHEFTCTSCEHSFEFTTHVSFEFESPAIEGGA